MSRFSYILFSTDFAAIKENKYILFESKKYVKHKYKWENRGKFKITLAILEDVLLKAKAIELE